MKSSIYSRALAKTIKGFGQFLPIIFGMLLLLSLMVAVVPRTFYAIIFSGNKLVDPIIGAVLGSVFEGNPVTSYVLGGELLEQGIGMFAVTAFILSWVTVGLIQLPAEILMLGKKFAIVRNIISFMMAIVIAILTIGTLLMTR